MVRMKTLPLFLLTFFALCLSCTLVGKCIADDTYLWQELKTENSFAFLRHALAPGTGDPPNFSIMDCTTQRLLSQNGRSQATNIGDRFRENGIHGAEVYSSQWCRCLETATRLNIGPVKELEILNSFFRRFENREKQTTALRRWLAHKKFNSPLILVTHQVNITAFTGIYPSSGELIVMKRKGPDTFSVIGTIHFD